MGKFILLYYLITILNDIKRHLKKRPVLIISEAHNNDYTILPVSTIPNKDNVDPVYDIFIPQDKFPELALDKKYTVNTNQIARVLYEKFNQQRRIQERAKRIEARASSYNSLSYVNNRHRNERFVDYDGVSKKPFQGGDFTP